MKPISNKIWLLILGVVLALSAAYAGYVVYRSQHAPDPADTIQGPIAIIYLDNQVVDIVDLGTVTESYTRKFEGVSGNTNTVEYAHGQVRVQSATCPDRVCIGQGWLHEGDILPIACLPNSLIIEVVSYEDIMGPVDGATN